VSGNEIPQSEFSIFFIMLLLLLIVKSVVVLLSPLRSTIVCRSTRGISRSLEKSLMRWSGQEEKSVSRVPGSGLRKGLKEKAVWGEGESFYEERICREEQIRILRFSGGSFEGVGHPGLRWMGHRCPREALDQKPVKEG
jgi:hypothetical protein